METPPTTILLVRHGETDEGKTRIFQGQQGSGLNGRGKAQAARLGERLRSRSIDALYTSDLQRARETAEIVGAAIGLTPRDEPGLREVFFGSWQGLTLAQITRQFPDDWTAWRDGVPDVRPGGGETYGELAARMAESVHCIADAHPGGILLVVSHGLALKTFVGEVLGMRPGSTVMAHSFRVQANTGISAVDRDADRSFRLLVWNDASHLEDLP